MRLTPAHLRILASLGDSPTIPPRGMDRTFGKLHRAKLVTIRTDKGDGWQRCGYVLTDAGRALVMP